MITTILTLLVRGEITIAGDNGTEVAFNSCAPCIECITKIDETTIYDVEDVDAVMLMYNLLEYSSSYSDTTGGFWFYSKNERTNFIADIGDNAAFQSSVNKTEFVGETEDQPTPNHISGILKNATITAPLKYLRNFWRPLER